MSSLMRSAGGGGLSVLIQFLGDASSAVNAAGKVSGAVSGAANTISGIGAGLAQAGQAMTLGITLPLVAVASAATKLASDFEDRMHRISAISADVKNNYAQYSKDILDISSKTGQNALGLADAMLTLTKYGLSGADSLKVLTVAAKDAQIGMVDAAIPAKLIAQTLTAYKLPASEAARVSDVLNKVVSTSSITWAQLATSIEKNVSLAAEVKVPIEQVGGALALLSRNGFEAAEASGQVNRILFQFIKPSKQVSDAAKQLGVDISATALETKGLGGVFADIASKVGVFELSTNSLTASKKAHSLAMQKERLALDESAAAQRNLLTAQKDGLLSSASGTAAITAQIKALQEMKSTSNETYDAEIAALRGAAAQGDQAAKLRIIAIGSEKKAAADSIQDQILGMENLKTNSKNLTAAQRAEITKRMQALTEETQQKRFRLQEQNLAYFDASVSGKSYTQVLADMSQKSGLTVTQLAMLFPSIRELRAAFVLAANGGKDLNDSIASMNGAAGETDKIFKERTATLKFAFESLKTNLEDLAIAIATRWLPRIEAVVNFFGKWIDHLRNLTPQQQDFIVQILAVVAALGPMLFLVGKIIESAGGFMSFLDTAGTLMGFLAGPEAIGGILVALAALVLFFPQVQKAWDSNFLGLKETATKFFDGLSPDIKARLLQVAGIIAQLGKGQLMTAFESLWSMLPAPLRQRIQDAQIELAKLPGKVLAWAQTEAPKFGDNIRTWTAQFWDWLSGKNGVLSQIVTKITALADAIKQAVDDPKVQKFFFDAGQSITEAIIGAMHWIEKWTAELTTTVLTWGPPLVQAFIKLTGSLGSVFTNLLRGMIFDALKNAGGQGMAEQWLAFVQARDAEAKKAVDADQPEWNQLMNTLFGPEALVRSNATASGATTGQAYIDGLNARITANSSKTAAAAAATTLSGMYTTALQNSFQIRSPSMLMQTEIGDPIIAGLVRSIVDGWSSLHAAWNDLVAQFRNTLGSTWTQDIAPIVDRWPLLFYSLGNDMMLQFARGLAAQLPAVVAQVRAAQATLAPLNTPSASAFSASSSRASASASAPSTSQAALGNGGAPTIKIYIGNSEIKSFVQDISYEAVSNVLTSA